MFKNYLKIAFRNIKKNKGYSFISISGLAIGMTCCILILLLVQYDLSFDNFHHKSDQICLLKEIQSFSGRPSRHYSMIPPPMGPAMTDDYPEVINYTRFFMVGAILPQYKDTRLEIGWPLLADPSVFQIFDFELVSGDPKTALNEPYSIVITEEIAQRFFEQDDPIGKVLSLDDVFVQGDPPNTPYIVTGVMKNIPSNSYLQFDALMSVRTWRAGADWIHKWEGNYSLTYLLLDKNTDYKELEKKFPEFVQKYLPDWTDNFVLYLQPLRDIHWDEIDKTYVYVSSVVALFVLLIACINFVNLATARSANRAKEVAMRKVMGAHRWQLIKQFLGESVFLSFCAMLITTALIKLALPVFNEISGEILVFDYFDNFVLLLDFIGIFLIVGILAGSYPAFFISAFQPTVVLKGSVKAGIRGIQLRRILVVAQFAISIILIICTGIMTKQLHYTQNKDMGFDKDNVLLLNIYPKMYGQMESIKHELLQNPAIIGVTASNSLFAFNLLTSDIDFEGRSQDESWNVPYMSIDYDFISFYGLELVAGRDFSREFATDSISAYIVNEALVNKLGWESPVGEPFALGKEAKNMGRVIGVVKDFHFDSFRKEIGPVVLCVRPNIYTLISVRIRPENVTETRQYLEKKWYQYSIPGRPLQKFYFLDENFAWRYRYDEKIRKISEVFSLIAVIIACMGLFGLISFTAEQRTKEIGIRKALGASVSSIFLLLSKEFLKLLGVAILIAWPIAWYIMDKWLQEFVYRIKLDWGIFVLAGALALVIALLTVSYQAVKAARANPVDSLRYE